MRGATIRCDAGSSTGRGLQSLPGGPQTHPDGTFLLLVEALATYHRHPLCCNQVPPAELLLFELPNQAVRLAAADASQSVRAEVWQALLLRNKASAIPAVRVLLAQAAL